MSADSAQASASPRRPTPPSSNQEIESQSQGDVRSELEQAIAGSNDVLATAKTTMTIFPSTITLDRAKLTETKRTFYRTAEVMTINVEDILNVTASVGPLFGSLKIVSRVMGNTEKPFTFRLMWRDDAQRFKRILQGYLIALQRSIDCSTLKTHELVKLLDQLGQDEHHKP